MRILKKSVPPGVFDRHFARGIFQIDAAVELPGWLFPDRPAESVFIPAGRYDLRVSRFFFTVFFPLEYRDEPRSDLFETTHIKYYKSNC